MDIFVGSCVVFLRLYSVSPTLKQQALLERWKLRSRKDKSKARKKTKKNRVLHPPYSHTRFNRAKQVSFAALHLRSVPSVTCFLMPARAAQLHVELASSSIRHQMLPPTPFLLWLFLPTLFVSLSQRFSPHSASFPLPSFLCAEWEDPCLLPRNMLGKERPKPSARSCSIGAKCSIRSQAPASF